MLYEFLIFFFSSIRLHTRCALVTGVQTCALPIYHGPFVCDAHDDGEWPLARSRTHEADAHASDDHGSEPRTHPGRVSGWAGAPSHADRPARPAIFLESVRKCGGQP